MNWFWDHIEGVTLAVTCLAPFVLIGMMLLISGNTKEAHELKGFPNDTTK